MDDVQENKAAKEAVAGIASQGHSRATRVSRPLDREGHLQQPQRCGEDMHTEDDAGMIKYVIRWFGCKCWKKRVCIPEDRSYIFWKVLTSIQCADCGGTFQIVKETTVAKLNGERRCILCGKHKVLRGHLVELEGFTLKRGNDERSVVFHESCFERLPRKERVVMGVTI